MSERLTGFLGFAIFPFGDGVVDLLARKSFGSVRLLEAIPNQIGADVGVGYVRHPSCPPKGYCCTAHLLFPSLLQYCNQVEKKTEMEALFNHKTGDRDHLLLEEDLECFSFVGARVFLGLWNSFMGFTPCPLPQKLLSLLKGYFMPKNAHKSLSRVTS